MTIKEAAIDRNNNLNIIRLFASLMVVYMHAFAISTGSQTQDIFYMLTNHKSLAGGIAVYIFFIISGFLICRSFDRSSSVISYAKARFLRIWPLLFIVVMVSALVVGPILTPYPLDIYFKGDILGFLKNMFFMSSNTMLPGIFANHYNHSMNGSLWTLMYEVIWYVLVVILSPLWKRFKQTGVVTLLILTALYLLYTYHNPGDIGPISGAFALNFAKLGMFFAMGMCYYLYEDKIKISFKMFLIAILGLVLGIIFTDFIVTFCLFGSYIIFYKAFQKHYVATWYDKVGDLSYGIYIMAFPIQQIVVDVFGKPSEVYKTMSMNPYMNMLITLIIVIPLAWLSWHFIEKPCLSLKNKKK